MEEFFARNRLSAYLDGELAAGEAREVEDALARSPELRAELAELRRGVDLLKLGGPLSAPPGFADRLEARLSGEAMPVGWRRYTRGVRVEAALLAAAAAVVLVFLARKPAEEAPTVAAVPPAEVPAGPPAAEAPPVEEPPAPAVDVAGAPGVAADGRLGGELAKKAGPRQQSFAGKSASTAKEAYQAPWEQQENAPETPPTVQVSAPFQFRLRPTSDTGLKELAALAASLGGTLADERGRPIAPYPMNAGDTRRVKLLLPSVNAGQVYARLQDLGAVDAVQINERTAYASGASVPVVIDVIQE